MIKADIVKAMVKELGVHDREALGIVDATLESMKEVILANGRLEIRNFGVFQVKARKPRIGRNPRDKVEYPIAPHNAVTFRPGKNVQLPPPDA